MTSPRAGGPQAVDARAVQVLVVDDEPALCELLASTLRLEGWQVATALTGRAAVRQVRSAPPDLVVLDVMLPDITGWRVLELIRAIRPQVPVLFLTARDAVEDRVAGLTAGADDYVTKPFSLDELVARVRTLLRRAGLDQDASATLLVGDLALDEESREVRRAGEPIRTTATEFDLLRYLMRNSGRMLTKAQILEHVWQYDFGGRSSVVDLYISYLRRKVDAGRPPMIRTVRGLGYLIRPAETATQDPSCDSPAG